MKHLRRLYKFLGSLQLAVLVILALAVISAWGTIMEAQYNTETAQKLVYHSPWMYGTMITLIVNLVISAFHRWPWQKRHIGFVVAHVGIIILLIGSYVTQKQGVDGSLAFGIGQSNQYVTINETEISVYIPVSENEVLPFFRQDVDFLKRPPQKYPTKLMLGDDALEVVDYYPYATQKMQIEPSNQKDDGPAVRFQISGSRMNMTDWLQQRGALPGVFNLGPAQVILHTRPFEPTGENEVLLEPKGPEQVAYRIYSKSRGVITKKGTLKIGDIVETGWMDFKFRLLNYYPSARVDVTYQKLERPTPVTTSAVKVRLADQEHWLGLNSTIEARAGETSYLLRYANKRIDLGFPLILKDFRIGRYEGTSRAASYESDVVVPGGKEVTISMNEPLVHKNYTFYQASFQEDPSGKATLSILSVNYDPGRWLKYLGSALIVLGSIIMFYFRKLLLQRAPNETTESAA